MSEARSLPRLSVWTLRVCTVCGRSEVVQGYNHRTCAGTISGPGWPGWHKPTPTREIEVVEREGVTSVAS